MSNCWFLFQCRPPVLRGFLFLALQKKERLLQEQPFLNQNYTGRLLALPVFFPVAGLYRCNGTGNPGSKAGQHLWLPGSIYFLHRNYPLYGCGAMVSTGIPDSRYRYLPSQRAHLPRGMDSLSGFTTIRSAFTCLA